MRFGGGGGGGSGLGNWTSFEGDWGGAPIGGSYGYGGSRYGWYGDWHRSNNRWVCDNDDIDWD
jgi:hypothetical protein